ncbi:MAG: hypothetical protein HOL70_08020 [Candidatus Marinimicrobia bacterium]|jgi:hypothetical protein|nr:hypothetical protein [Candidatus Neomarinimicrobiota bacterium]
MNKKRGVIISISTIILISISTFLYFKYETNKWLNLEPIEWTTAKNQVRENCKAIILPTDNQELISYWSKMSPDFPDYHNNRNQPEYKNRYFTHISIRKDEQSIQAVGLNISSCWVFFSGNDLGNGSISYETEAGRTNRIQVIGFPVY